MLSHKRALKLSPRTIERLEALTRKRNFEKGENHIWTEVGRQLLEQALALEEKKAPREDCM